MADEKGLEEPGSCFSTCPCGRSFTRKQWDALELIGYSPATRDHEGPLLELRNCVCTSTITHPVASLRDLVRAINQKLRENRKQQEQHQQFRRGLEIEQPLTERQREGMRRVLWKLSSTTSARWDQHLRDEIGDQDADAVIAWVRSEIGETA